MPLPEVLKRVPFPVIASPMFIISTPKLVIAQCKAGVVGSMPALNARTAAQLDEWLAEITEALDAHNRAHPEQPAAPFAINQIVHKSNDRLDHDLEMCVKYKVPVIITSLGAREDVNQAVHGYGGVVLHDVINNKFARKAVEKGADGLVAVAGLAPDQLGDGDPSQMSFGSKNAGEAKAWKDIWGCGQGIGAIKQVVPTAELVARLKAEYAAAKAAICQG